MADRTARPDADLSAEVEGTRTPAALVDAPPVNPRSRERELWAGLPLPAMLQRQERRLQEGMREYAHLLDSNEN